MNCLKEHKIGERRQDPADRRVILVELRAEMQEMSRRIMRAAGATQGGPELLDGRGGPDVLEKFEVDGPGGLLATRRCSQTLQEEEIWRV